jgi:hypothetical protein
VLTIFLLFIWVSGSYSIALTPNNRTAFPDVWMVCSYAQVEENENVVNYALRKRHVKVVPSGLEFGRPGYCKYRDFRFHPSLTHSRRFYPHAHNLDGEELCHEIIACHSTLPFPGRCMRSVKCTNLLGSASLTGIH